ncbi:hypothetical protein NKR19_g7871 [Coniochaeta hoffmannii]|uniref:Uncharacterized protein n=1 Tax=Coniochaeta hoffmannii TaxID=91930 RepID=A0AA38VKZ0_9PEZI|nr:hypothetical protein NKR19_g7871 [Coniochaeta hoffmannii]
MCTYYYLHHHHIPPCTRDIDIVVHYVFCPSSGTAPAQSVDSSSPFAPRGTASAPAKAVAATTTGSSATSEGSSHTATVQTPCSNLYFDPSQSVDYSDPCASGGCLASPDCSSGACRLEQLSGQWRCCRCGQGGNRYRWCRQRMRRSPDTFCYHVCCGDCTADDRE